MTTQFLSGGTCLTTRWPYEVWVIRDRKGWPVAQVTLYRHAGQWYAWTEHKICPKYKRRARALARVRNRGEGARIAA